jgi:transposase-like protein
MEDHNNDQLQNGTLGSPEQGRAGRDPQFLRDGLRLLTHELMEAEVTEAIGAALYERTE